MSQVFRVAVGNTERRIEDIARDIRNVDLPISRIVIDNSSTDPMILNVAVADDSINENELKTRLNEHGGCMYQIISANKIEE